MIAELAHVILWIAALCAVAQLALGVAFLRQTAGGAAQGISLNEGVRAIRWLALAQGLAAAFSFAALVWLFVQSDMSVQLVAMNSHSDKPLMYKIAGAWGNHEGSMLLWVTILTASGAAIAWFERGLSQRLFIATLTAQASISAGFFLFLLLTSNPFVRLNPAAENGAGLNPLLQDPGLAFHPPTLYIGYVGLSVAFSFAVGALLVRDVGPAFARAMRPWVLIAWVFLTIGITAGSYWAYYELGWGGYWFWDPVENASLMPWLAATALLHSASVTAKRDALRAWTISLALIAFSFSILGTFIVRSGLLTSVHSFAVDPKRGIFILGLMSLYVGGAFTLFALRISSVAEGKRFALFSRETGLVINNLLLAIILAIVAFGTLFPMIADAMGSPISVGAPYFNLAIAPFALLIVGALMVAPSLQWRRSSLKNISMRAAISAALVVFAFVMLMWRASGITVLAMAGLALACGLGVASFFPLFGRNLRRTPLPVFGMVTAHFGVALLLGGMASEASFSREKFAAVTPGTPVSVGPWQIALRDVVPVAGRNWTALEGQVAAVRGDKSHQLRPQSRYFTAPVTETNEAALLNQWDGQLYVVLGKPDTKGRWQVRLWWKPFVQLIWAGGLLIALGGAIACLGHIGAPAHLRTARQRLFGPKGYGA
jgi:cytochrome c-type biogenesis protein CcmF